MSVMESAQSIPMVVENPPLPVMESVYIAFFLLVIVFIALFCLYVCIRLFSTAFVQLEKTGKLSPSK